MADSLITALTANTAPLKTDLFVIEDDPAGTPLTQKITGENVFKIVGDLTEDVSPTLSTTYIAAVNGSGDPIKVKAENIGGSGGGGTNVEGSMYNGKIAVSVASNNITVALKTLAGSDPSAGDPVKVRIGDTERSVTAALSVTKNAGTNWFNAGSSELATKEIDYFVYLIWNTTPATDVVDIGFARIPYATVYSEFSGTTTNEKYLASGNASAPTSTDNVVVIGRFAATLSATASFNWSVPTFTNTNLIQRPIYETRWLTWAPAYSASGSMTYTSVSTNIAQYQVKGRNVEYNFQSTGTTGGTASVSILATLPFDSLNIATTSEAYPASAGDGTTVLGFCFLTSGTPNKLTIRKYDASNWGLGASRSGTSRGQYTI